MLPKHTICQRNSILSKMGYISEFQRFMQQNSEKQGKHTICLRN
ncbi:hypothetical protein E2C01_061782 [Portunus trituberculatus]|uniref:Uncharacterized protein n=1 Tax=Portunus trituberculatus TaxID=210409 RepID=A0A5B7HDC2_PORTR|nr:hypothetical protein [Portunus trituberculatus]